ncbi:GIY-YIG nuclease family protein [Pedobacter sp. BS3]|uniref:GIY-YIG nuclease family protein n=1 Tax=Pedobacter sp. BS3 TaxID=2567937 RepID=UPI0011EE077A|nr:GIY-YIG nuclease family protein [Pedobacter sp. BS3]TZF83628.1 GIY-YIG nuclease family protein [Pedobacter sp. BS3]
MKKYVYIVTDRNRNSLHVGTSTDLIKTVKFYRDMPSLFFDTSNHATRLVYFEELNTEQAALDRFQLISTYTRTQKERLIRQVNPDWIDLTIGLDFEHVVYRKLETIPSHKLIRDTLIVRKTA